MKWIAVMALVFIAGIIVGAIRPYAPKVAMASESYTDDMTYHGDYALRTLTRKLQKQCGRKFETKTSSDGREETTDVDCICCRNEWCACAGVRAMYVWQGYDSNWDVNESDAESRPEVQS